MFVKILLVITVSIWSLCYGAFTSNTITLHLSNSGIFSSAVQNKRNGLDWAQAGTNSNNCDDSISVTGLGSTDLRFTIKCNRDGQTSVADLFKTDAGCGTTNTYYSICNSVPEDQLAMIDCPGTLIAKELQFASYGTPTGSCGSFQIGACNAQSSRSALEVRCDNQHFCSVPVNNDVFSDPCPYTPKSLKVQYGCRNTNPTGCPNSPYPMFGLATSARTPGKLNFYFGVDLTRNGQTRTFYFGQGSFKQGTQTNNNWWVGGPFVFRDNNNQIFLDFSDGTSFTYDRVAITLNGGSNDVFLLGV